MYTFMLLLFLPLLTLAACVPASTVPIGTTSFHRSEKAERRTLLVFLPGRGDTVSSYEKEGFIRQLAGRSEAVDTLGVEAHLGYYLDRSLLQRLREDVILPAKAEGYQDIWLVGISMGGLGAVLYDATYPGDVTGMFLLAPYLGDGTLLNEIAASGGFAAWKSAAVEVGSIDLDREIWLKLKAYTDVTKSAKRLYLGYGENDRFAATNLVFSTVLPVSQVVTAPGGHDWPTWRALWPVLLELSPLKGDGRTAGKKFVETEQQNFQPDPINGAYLTLREQPAKRLIMK